MNKKTAIIFGSTGLTGQHLTSLLLEDDDFDTVKIFVRRIIDIQHIKLEQILIDFNNPNLVADAIYGDVIFLCLGTTMAKAGGKEAFYKVDYTYTAEMAKIAHTNGVQTALLISSMGANANSLIYYSKVKGQIENTLTNMGFSNLAIIRPSLLLGNRSEQRTGEKIAMYLSKTLSGMFVGPLKKYNAIEAKSVAVAMIKIAKNMSNGTTIYESHSLDKIVSN